MYMLIAFVISFFIEYLDYLLMRKCCTLPETVRSPAITFFPLHTPHFTVNSSIAQLPGSLFNSAKNNTNKRKFKQIYNKRERKKKGKILPVLKSVSSFFWRSFRETVSAFRIFSLMALSSLAPAFLFLWTFPGVSLGVFDWIDWLDLSVRFPLLLSFWISITIVLADPKVVIFSTTWTTIKEH